MPFLHVTSKVDGEPHPNLLQEKGGAGPPYIAFLDAQANLLAQVSYAKMRELGVGAFAAALEGDVASFYALQKKAATGDAAAKREFFMRRFELDHQGIDELRAAIGKGTFLTEDQVAEVKDRLVEMLTNKTLAGLDESKPQTFAPYAKKLLGQHADLGLPEGPAGLTAWFVILEDAWLRRDAKTFGIAFTAMKAGGMTAKSFVTKNTARLKELNSKPKEVGR